MEMKKIARAVLAIGVAGFASNIAFAADESNVKVEKIEVTGSRIKRISAETASPVTVIGREQIERSGKATVAEVLKTIASNPGGSYDESFSNSFAPGAAGVGLRGLGQKSTLTLLNGRRMPAYGFAQNLQDNFVDLNTIPASAIQRIEIVKDGASAIYGSDAIAGVVNVILRKDFQGLEVSASTGVSQQGGGEEYRAATTGGFSSADGKFNILGTVDLFKRQQLFASERDFTRGLDFSNRPAGTLTLSTGGGTLTLPGNVRAPIKSCAPSELVAAKLLNPALSGTACAFELSKYLPLYPGTKRANLFTRATWDFTADTQLFAEGSYSKTTTNQDFTPASFGSSVSHYDPATGGVKFENTQLPIGHPLNPRAALTTLTYAFRDMGPRSSTIDSETYRVLAGLKGSFGSGYEWEAAASTSQNDITNAQTNRMNWVELVSAIKNKTYDFTQPGSSANAAIIEKIRINPTRKSTSKLSTFDAKVSGELMQLPAGPVGFATGIDYRDESIKDTPDAKLAAGLVAGQGATSVDGSRKVTALFGEVVVPVTRTLELDVAARGDDYSDFGSKVSPKVSLKWTPTKTVLFRGSYGEGFRAPSLAENSKSSATFFTTVQDPKNGNRSVSIAGVYGSNPDLNPETSKSYSLGMVFEPNADFNASVDFYKITQYNLVSADSFSTILSKEGTPAVAGQILRDTDGALLSVTSKYLNQAYVMTKGVDVNATRRINLGEYGKFALGFDGTYIMDYKLPPAIGEDAVQYAGNNGNGALPRFKGSISGNWDKGALNLNTRINYSGSYAQVNIGGQDSVNSWTTVDVNASYKFSKNFTASLAINNLFDRDPPWSADFTTGYDYTQSNVQGRFYRATANYAF